MPDLTKRALGGALALSTLLLATGCSGLLGGELVRKGEQAGAITIVNDTGVEFNVVTLSRCNGSTHGISRLNSGETIPSGYSRTWRVGSGCWDVGVGRTGACAAGTCSWHEAYDKVQVTSGQTSYSSWGTGGAR